MRDKSAVLSNLSSYYTWKKIKKVVQNIKSKISDPTRNDKFELPDGWNLLKYSRLFWINHQKYKTVTDNLPARFI